MEENSTSQVTWRKSRLCKSLLQLVPILLLSTLSFISKAQDLTVKGIVKDDTGSELPGVNIIVKGTTNGTTTDASGAYSITVGSGQTVLVFSFIGYAPQEIDVNGRAVIDVGMLPDASTLQEVVVIGYTTQAKKDVTGAVSTIGGDVISKTPVTDVSSVLQGRVAGVTVEGQGGPGTPQVVRVRGYGTLGNNNPLYVIDGVQTTGGLNLINQNDIESITVLKDAASCAQYGARGSSGVIVITTKRGKIGTPKLEYDGYLGYEVPRKFPKLMSPQQYADALWGYYENSGQTPTSSLYGSGTSPVLPDYIIEEDGGPQNLGVMEGDPAANPDLYDLKTYRILKTNKQGTDWFREVFQPALTQNHQLTISGATEKNNYAISFNYLDNKGTLVNSFFKRYSTRINTEFNIKPWLRIGENIQIAYSQGNTISGHTDQNIVANLYGTSGLLPVYDIAGNLSGTKGASQLGGNNPVSDRVQSTYNKGYSARLMGGVYAEVEPVKNLIFQSRLTLDYNPYQYRFFGIPYPQETYSSIFTTFSETAGYGVEWRNTNKLSYEFTLNEQHKFSAFVAYEASEYTSRAVGGSNDSLFFTTPGFQVYGAGRLKNIEAYGGADKLTYLSTFGSLNYAFKDKYLATFTVRRDGSSKFGQKNRYGVFPSGTVGWRISGESFMTDVSWVDDLKIRASLGTSGNEASLLSGQTSNQYYTDPSYTYYDLGGSNSSAMPGFALTQIGNPFLQWEVNRTINVGVDAAIFNSRWNISFNWFNRLTDKLLYQPPVTVLQGDAGAPFRNVMNFTNKGIELELGYTSLKNRSVSYDVNFNFSTYRNNVDYIDGDPNTFILGGLYARQTNLSRSVVGMPLSSFYGYIYEGIFQSEEDVTNHATQAGITPLNGPGHFKFKDISGPDGTPDGKVDDMDRTFIGNPHPKFTYGLNVNVFYKKFDLSIFFQGVQGNDIFNYWRASSEWPGKLGEGSLDTWSESNKDAKLPIWSTTVVDDSRPSTFFIEDGSYMRVKNIQIGYTLPGFGTFSKLRVYGQMYNALTFTNYSGMDPEVSTGVARDIGIDFGGYYPVAMKFLIGVNLGL